jgi:hypothetical protein
MIMSRVLYQEYRKWLAFLVSVFIVTYIFFQLPRLIDQLLKNTIKSNNMPIYVAIVFLWTLASYILFRWTFKDPGIKRVMGLYLYGFLALLLSVLFGFITMGFLNCFESIIQYSLNVLFPTLSSMTITDAGFWLSFFLLILIGGVLLYRTIIIKITPKGIHPVYVTMMAGLISLVLELLSFAPFSTNSTLKNYVWGFAVATIYLMLTFYLLIFQFMIHSEKSIKE